MAAIASGDVTVTEVARQIIGRQRVNEVTIAFGDGSLTYPSGGVPMTLAKLGLKRDIKELRIVDGGGDGFKYDWDKANNKIRIFTQGIEVDAAGSATLDDFPLTAGVGVSSVSVSLTNNTGAGVKRLGGMKELATTDVPEVTLKAIAVGW
jgi:hypothetical protein